MPNRDIAQTSAALALYKEVIAEYGAHLHWMRAQPLAEGANREQQLAIGLLALSVYRSGRAIVALYENGQGESSPIFVRSQFEQAAKAEYFANHAQRAKDFLLLEPFERYKLTQGYAIRPELRDEIIAECKATVHRHPELLRHQSKQTTGKRRADFLAIREALKPPDMQDLISKNKWNTDLYVIIFLLGSLGIHGSINEVRNYFDIDQDNVIRFAADADMMGAPDYLLQSMNYFFGFIGKIANWFPPGFAERSDAVRSLHERQQAMGSELALLGDRSEALADPTIPG